MNIDRVEVRRYRSLYDVSIEPGPLTVLVGPNNSGKTNVMEALHFLAETYEFDLETAINRKGGFENVAHRRKRRTKVPVEFSVNVTASVAEIRNRTGGVRVRRSKKEVDGRAKLLIKHSFGFAASSSAIQADFYVKNEELSVAFRRRVGDDPKQLFRVVRTGNDIEIEVLASENKVESRREDPLWHLVQPFDDEGFQEYLSDRVRTDQLFLTQATFNWVLDFFTGQMSKMSLFQLSPLEVRRSGVPTPNAALGRHGENLPALVAHMRRHSPKQWSAVLAAMQRIVADLQDIRTDFTPDRRLTLQFVEREAGRPWGVEEVSDGTMQSLALFMTVLDPRLPVLMLEEPENSVHPWILRVLVDLCRDAAGKQIIISTHSPALLNYVRPSEVWAVWRKAGRSQMSRLELLDEDVFTLWETGQVGLAEYLDSGAVDEVVPGRDGA